MISQEGFVRQYSLDRAGLLPPGTGAGANDVANRLNQRLSGSERRKRIYCRP